MHIYKVGLGHNLTLPELTTLTPQPRAGDVQAERVYTDEGAQERNFFLVLRWNIISGEEAYQELMSQLGLSTRKTREITIYARRLFLPQLYNGLAVKPEFGEDITWNKYYPRDISVYVNRLELIS